MQSFDNVHVQVEDSSTGSATIHTTSPTLNAQLSEMPTTKILLSQESPGAVLSVSAGQWDDIAHCEKVSTPTIMSASTQRAIYCSTGMQTMPPTNAEDFHKIHGREPTHDELVKKMGCAGIGRYEPGPRPYEVIIGKPFPTEPSSRDLFVSQETAFQTSEVVHVKNSLVHAKAKATALAKRQLNAAKAAGYNIWPETNEDRVIHMEQYYIDIQLDDEGNATNVDVRGHSLPNICGEEINPTPLTLHQDQHDQVKTHMRTVRADTSFNSKAGTSFSVLEPGLSPRLPPEEEAVREPPRLQQIPSARFSSPGADPVAIEDYGYFTLVLKNDRKKESPKRTQTHNSQNSESAVKLREDEVPTIVVRRERFADEFIVHDATEAPPEIPKGPRKRTPNHREGARGAQEASKRSKTTDSNDVGNSPYLRMRGKTHQYEVPSMYLDASLRGSIERDGKSQQSTKDGSRHEHSSDPVQSGRADGRASDHDSSRHTSRMRNSHRDRSRSPVDRHGSSRYKSRSRARNASRKPFEEEQRHARTAKVDQEPHTPRASASGHAADKMHDMFKPEEKTREAADSSVQNAQQGHGVANTQRQATRNAVQELDPAKRNAQPKKEEAASRARDVEDRHRREQDKIKEAEQLEKKRQLEEAEIKRARDAKDLQKLEREEKKQAREAERRRQKEGRNHCREQERAADRDKEKRDGCHEIDDPSHSTHVDGYAREREAQNRRREEASGLPVPTNSGTGRRSARERSQRHAQDAERRAPEKKADNKVTKRRPERGARGELERYDPRKRFGRGR
ncbi:MIP-T3 multi-domain protein [Pyrenophora tritici-repentis]|nr:MIP-T3 multi-domain protein [Pyrenophora tritici-repentis]